MSINYCIKRFASFCDIGALVTILFLCLALVPDVSAQSRDARNFASGVHSAVPLPSQIPLSSITSSAPPLGGANIVVNSPTGGAQNETSITVNRNNPSNLIGGANDYRTGDSRCGRYFSTDNGRTWTDLSPFPMFTGAGTTTAFTAAGDPGIAIDANGHAYYLCMYFTRTPGSDATQYVHKSLDGGATWGPPIQVSSAAARSHFDDKGHIAVDNKSFTAHRGNVYVAWARLDQNQIRFARSTNGGVSFDPDIQVNGAANAVTGVNIAVGIDGAVYVTWIDLTTNQIMIDKSTNGGQNFGALTGGTDHTIRSLTPTGSVRPLTRVNSFPVIAADASNPNNVYAVWAEDPPGNDDSDIMFARSTDGGDNWSTPIRVNDEINPPGDFNSQFFPWMAVDPTDGSINVVWYDDRTDPSHTDATPLVDLFFASSNDGGLSFSLNSRISTQSSDTTTNFGSGSNQFFGDYNAIDAFGGVAYPLWTDSRSGDQDLMTTQVGGADLAITKVSPTQVNAGSTLTYTITVTSGGPAVAFNVLVTDTLPAGVTFAGSTVPCIGSPRVCSVGNLAPGDSTTFTINVTVAPAVVAGTTLTNTATVAADQQDPDLTNNTASASTIVTESADLRLTKDCKPDGPAPTGSTATCTILVDNLGPSDARNVVVTDTHLSNGAFTITSATFSPPTASLCAIAGGIVTCNLGTEPSGGRTTITVQLTSNNQVDVNDTATVASSTPDPNPSNNTGQDSVSFRGVADLSLTKSDAPDPVTAGTNLTYTVNVTNNGPSSAPNVVVRDVLPVQVSVVSATPSQGSCSGTTVPGDPLQPLTCNLGTIGNGASASITVVVKVNQNTPNGTILINNASVSSDYADPNNGNNNATASTTVQTRADLVIVKTSDKPTYKPSSLITYTVTVVNNGPSDAQAVVVTDNLPTVQQVIYLSDTGGCTKSGSILTCNMGTLLVGQSKSFNINMTVKGSRGTVTNTATVSSTTTDPTPANNTSVLNVTVQGGG